MQEKKIIQFLTKNITPLPNTIYGKGYRASVTLTDGTYLPCVIFRSPRDKVNLAIKRFKQEKSGKGIFNFGGSSAYYQIVKNFVAIGNTVNYFDIEKIEKSPYAFPNNILKSIEGETTMGWTGFTARMKDGKLFGFGTQFTTEFFSLPEGYETDDIVEIINHSFVDTDGQLRYHKSPENIHINWEEVKVYRERPFFECYIDGLY